MNTQNNKNANNRKGFSLPEILSVISIIGIISAVALPNVSRVNESAKEATAKRNAQNLASVCISAQSAGLDFVAKNDNLEETISNIVTGGHVSGGTFDGAYFGLPSVSEEEQASALRFLSILDGSIVYDPNGNIAQVPKDEAIKPLHPGPDNAIIPPSPGSDADQPSFTPTLAPDAGGGQSQSPAVSVISTRNPSFAEESLNPPIRTNPSVLQSSPPPSVSQIQPVASISQPGMSYSPGVNSGETVTPVNLPFAPPPPSVSQIEPAPPIAMPGIFIEPPLPSVSLIEPEPPIALPGYFNEEPVNADDPPFSSPLPTEGLFQFPTGNTNVPADNSLLSSGTNTQLIITKEPGSAPLIGDRSTAVEPQRPALTPTLMSASAPMSLLPRRAENDQAAPPPVRQK